MARAFVGMGSNLDPARNVLEAVRLLSGRTRILGVSEVYQTEPVGRLDQPPFYNAVVEIETEVPPRELKFGVLRRIESDLGRVRTGDKNAPRTIDLDLLLYDELSVEAEDLVLPDPQILERAFLAVPLSELAPALDVPGTGASLETIASRLGRAGLRPVPGFAERLKKEIGHGPQP